MVITARGNERRLTPVALRQRETEHAAVEGQRAFQVGNLEMHMANADFWINR